jgi:hypothetical protein
MIIDTGVVRFVVPDVFHDRTTYSYACPQGRLEIGYPAKLRDKTAADLMEDRRREIHQVTKALLGSKVVISDGVEPVELAGQPGARLRSTAKDARHFVHHSLATAAIGASTRLEVRWSADADYPPGQDPDRVAARLFDHVVASIVPVPRSPVLSRGWVAQSCGAYALVVPAAFSRPTSFAFEGAHGERLAIAIGTAPAPRWRYFDETRDRLQIRDDARQALGGVDERRLVVERQRDEQRVTDAVVLPARHDVHAIREAKLTRHDGTPVVILGGAPVASPVEIDDWWRAVVHSVAMAMPQELHEL